MTYVDTTDPASLMWYVLQISILRCEAENEGGAGIMQAAASAKCWWMSLGRVLMLIAVFYLALAWLGASAKLNGVTQL